MLLSQVNDTFFYLPIHYTFTVSRRNTCLRTDICPLQTGLLQFSLLVQRRIL